MKVTTFVQHLLDIFVYFYIFISLLCMLMYTSCMFGILIWYLF